LAVAAATGLAVAAVVAAGPAVVAVAAAGLPGANLAGRSFKGLIDLRALADSFGPGPFLFLGGCREYLPHGRVLAG
jgi:hypothetical protein